METKNANAKFAEWFKVQFHHSDGFGQSSREAEWFVDIYELKNMFNGEGEIIEYVEQWLDGYFDDDVEIVLDDEVRVSLQKTFEGGLMLEFQERYRSGGYDDDPVFRFNSDIYVISEE